MKGLSIRQPWVWAILNADKGVENREWDPDGGNVAHARRLIADGGEFLIHASKGCTGDEYLDAGDFMRDVYAARPWDGSTILPALKSPLLTRGAIVARARLVDLIHTGNGGHRRASGRFSPGTMCLACGSDMTDRDAPPCPKADPWAIPGCLGLILADVRPLAEPVPFKGALGFFDVPDGTIGGAP